jgi:hypothetical protein
MSHDMMCILAFRGLIIDDHAYGMSIRDTRRDSGQTQPSALSAVRLLIGLEAVQLSDISESQAG